MPQPMANVKRMKVFRMPDLERAGGISCAWIGRGEVPRPDPSSLLETLGAWDRPPALATVSQIHSNRWLRAEREAGGGHKVLGEADAILTAEPHLALGIATADCLPIVAVDSQAPALAVIHAGWRGSAHGWRPRRRGWMAVSGGGSMSWTRSFAAAPPASRRSVRSASWAAATQSPGTMTARGSCATPRRCPRASGSTSPSSEASWSATYARQRRR